MHRTARAESHDIGLTTPDHGSARPLRILVVDDDPLLLALTTRSLRRIGAEVILAGCEKSAAGTLRHLRTDGLRPDGRTRSPDLVVCDGLEGGWRDVRAAADGIPFLLLSGDPRRVDEARRRLVPAILRAGAAWGSRLRRAARALPGVWPPADLLWLFADESRAS